MSTNLSKLLETGGLRQCKVVSGLSGLEKTISYVTVMEVPDITTWLKGNELILTSLYPIKDDYKAQGELIDRLHEVGTSAIAIKPNRYVQTIPDIMKVKSNKFNIPIIEIPEEVSYLDILTPAMNTIFNQKIILEEDLEHAVGELSHVLLKKNQFHSFLETVSKLTQSEIGLEVIPPYIELSLPENEIEPLNHIQLKKIEENGKSLWMNRKKANIIYEGCIVTPIYVEGRMSGMLTSFGQRGNVEMQTAILEKAAKILSLEFLREKVKYEIEQKYRDEFFSDLFFNQHINKEDLVDKGKKYGFRENEEYVCIAVHYKGDVEKGTSELIADLECAMSTIEYDVIIGQVRHSTYILFPVKGRNQKELKGSIELFSEKVCYKYINFCLGVGRTYKGIEGLRKSFKEAKQSVIFGPLWSEKSINYFQAIGLYRLVSLIDNKEELKQLYEETIGKLVVKEDKSELDLIETLEVYFNNNESLRETADQLYIHVNTLKYRLSKIKLLTGLDLNRSEEKVMLNMGLKIHRYLDNYNKFT